VFALIVAVVFGLAPELPHHTIPPGEQPRMIDTNPVPAKPE
jgi:hypothetical protein